MISIQYKMSFCIKVDDINLKTTFWHPFALHQCDHNNFDILENVLLEQNKVLF